MLIIEKLVNLSFVKITPTYCFVVNISSNGRSRCQAYIFQKDESNLYTW